MSKMNSVFCLILGLLIQLSPMHGQTVNGSNSDDAPVHTYRFRSDKLNFYDVQPSGVCTPRLDLEPHVIPLLKDFQDMDLFRKLEERVFAGCQPLCKNGGVCQVGAISGVKECLCPLNFTGPSCEQGNVPTLTACDEATCRNGGYCVGTDSQPACSCPDHIRGPLCERRARSYQVVLKLTTSGGEPYNQSNTKNLTAVANAAANLIHLSAKLGDNPTLVGAYLRSEWDVAANTTGGDFAFRLLFDFTDTLAGIYTNQCILGHVITGMDKLSKLLTEDAQTTAVGRVKMSRLYVQGENLCSSGNHDCSRHAVCIPTNFGTYTCQCNTFTIDVSMDDRFPGRRCVYDGLIILTMVLIGFIMSTLIILFCGCRRTIWYRCRRKTDSEHMTLVNVAQNYDI